MAKVTGVYGITNMQNGKIYIGSSIDVHRRWAEHRRDLVKRRHVNKHLQNAFCKYGPDSFNFTLLEEIYGRRSLLEAEQTWLDNTQCYKEEYGYNTAHIAESPNLFNYAGKARDTTSKVWLITDPDGNSLQIHNLTEFCKREKLSAGCMREVAKGKTKQHKGWVCDYTDENKKQKAVALREKIACRPSLVITSPTREEFHTNNLADFCTWRGLDPTSMREVARGKAKHHKGWTCDYTDQHRKVEAEKMRRSIKQRKTFLLTNPEGVTLQTQNLSTFCEENDLNYGRMRAVAQGVKIHPGEWFCDYMNQDKREYAELRRKKWRKRVKR